MIMVKAIAILIMAFTPFALTIEASFAAHEYASTSCRREGDRPIIMLMLLVLAAAFMASIAVSALGVSEILDMVWAI